MTRTKRICSEAHRFESRSGGSTVRASQFRIADGVEEVHLCIAPRRPGGFGAHLHEIETAYAEALERLGVPESSAVFRRFFLSDAANQETLLTKRPIAISSSEAPVAVSIVEQPPLPDGRIALWAYHMVNGARGLTKLAFSGGAMVATHNTMQLWMTDSSRYASGNAHGARAQTAAAFNAVGHKLRAMGANLKDHLIRTWVFVHDVDLFYGDMVDVRRELMWRQGLTPETHYVASTGIAGRRADPERIVQLEALAVPTLRPEQVKYLTSPDHLGPTHDYGVTFERGVCVDYGDRQHILISGTASIDPHGNTIHKLDVAAQSERTFANIKGLLADANADFDDLAQMIVYLRDPADRCLVEPFLQEHFGEVPYLLVHAPVCRPGWLIEVECWALKPGGNASWGKL